MPPIFIPPLLKLVLGALGAGAVIHWVAKEVRRVNAELDRVKNATAIERDQREQMPTLRRDPQSGDWRVR